MDNLENNISNVSNNYYHYLMSLKNVNGVGLSYKYINDKNTFEPCICVLVENKINSKFLASNNIIPKEYMGIKTDVVSIGKISLNISGILFFKMRPLEGGAGIGPIHDRVFGSVCCIVKKIIKKRFFQETRYYILSNNHLLANNNKYPIGTLFMQPSLTENGNISTDIVAGLETFIPLKFLEDDPQAENFVDAAIAEIFDSSIISNTIFSQGKIKGTTEPALLTYVKKVGYKTGLTSGHIRATNSTINLKLSDNSSLVFKNQIISELQTDFGDSGSAIFTQDNKLVGMHMGRAAGGFSIANNINIILKKLNVQLL